MGYIERIESVGGVEFVNEPHLNNRELDPMVRNILFANAFGMSYGESKRKSERTKMDITSKQANGNAHGRAPWGYEIECRVCGMVTHRADDGSIVRCGHKDTKRFVPTETGRRYVPAIFEMIIDGKSLRDVAAYLTSEGVPTGQGNAVWHEAYIGNRLVRNSIYYGQRVGSPNLDVEALVSATTWQQANATLASRVRPGRDATVHAKSLVAPVCGACYGISRVGCTDGQSRMYRVFAGTGHNRKAYYRCSGSGPQRKGCGAPMIACTDLDETVIESMLADGQPHRDKVYVPGDDKADEIARLRLRLDKATTRAESNALWDEIETLEAEPSRPGHWTVKETDESEGAYFERLSPDERRAYLAKHVVYAHRDLDAGIPVVSITTR